MRDYSKVSPQFWIGTTGKALRNCGPEAQLVALYLLTNPHANMLGLYYLPEIFVAHETGLTIEGASKGLARCIEVHFCSYDATTEMVWVHEMAAYQIGEQLSETDKRCVGISNEYEGLPENPFLLAFYERYATAFHMCRARKSTLSATSPIEGPSKPHRSQEQETEQEQEHEQENPTASATPTRTAARPKKDSRESEPEWWLAFKSTYPARSGDQGWRKALRAANERQREGHLPSEFMAGAERYAEHCRVTGKTGTEYVKQAATFLGPDKFFLELWKPPLSKADIRFAGNLSAAQEFMRRTEVTQ
jgi:hypothetical protein